MIRTFTTFAQWLTAKGSARTTMYLLFRHIPAIHILLTSHHWKRDSVFFFFHRRRCLFFSPHLPVTVPLRQQCVSTFLYCREKFAFLRRKTLKAIFISHPKERNLVVISLAGISIGWELSDFDHFFLSTALIVTVISVTILTGDF